MPSMLNRFTRKKIKSKFHRLVHGFDSANYWENRYKKGGNSGAGSYSRLASFKAEKINDFIDVHHIQSCVEWGFGDGNQLAMFSIPTYHGLDVSQTVVDQARITFDADKTKSFQLVKEFNRKQKPFELSMSLDVIYHLIEDTVFTSYMRDLFDSSEKFVIIYASNKTDENYDPGHHVKHRAFSDWVEKNRPEFQQIDMIPNPYPEDSNNPKETSFADFYFYEKVDR